MNYKLVNPERQIKTKRMNSSSNFDEILKIFFSDKDLNQFHKTIVGKKLSPDKNVSEFALTGKKQIEYQPGDQSEIRRKIDLLITFASERLSRNKYIALIQNLGYYSINIGDLFIAISLFEKVIEEVKKERYYFLIKADAFVNLSEIYRRITNWQQSFFYANKASKLYEKYNDTKGISNCLNLLGTIYGEQGQLKKAQNNFEKSLGKAGKFYNSEFKGKIEINLGIINDILGKYNDALTHFNRALIIYNRTGNLKRIAEVRHNMGFTQINVQRPLDALNEFDKSINASMRIDYLPVLGISYLGKSYAFTLQKDYYLADAFADKAMQICNRTNDGLSIADAYKIKGIIQRERNNIAEAENLLKTSLRINKEHGNKLNEAETSFELGILYKNIGSTPKSRVMFQEALKYFKSLRADVRVKAIKEQISNLPAA